MHTIVPVCIVAALIDSYPGMHTRVPGYAYPGYAYPGAAADPIVILHYIIIIIIIIIITNNKNN